MTNDEVLSKLQEIPGHPISLGEAEELEMLVGSTFSKLQAGEVESEVRVILALVTVFGKRVLPKLTMDDVRKLGATDIAPIADRLGEVMSSNGSPSDPT